MTFDPATVSSLAIERHARALQGREFARLLGLAAAGLSRLTERFVLRLTQQRVIDELYQLDDHMLEDIGLTRGDIEQRVIAAAEVHVGDLVANTVTTAPAAPQAANDPVLRPVRAA